MFDVLLNRILKLEFNVYDMLWDLFYYVFWILGQVQESLQDCMSWINWVSEHNKEERDKIHNS